MSRTRGRSTLPSSSSPSPSLSCSSPSSHVRCRPLSPPPEEKNNPGPKERENRSTESPSRWQRKRKGPGDGDDDDDGRVSPPSRAAVSSPLFFMSFSPQNQNYASSFSTTSQTSPDQTTSSTSFPSNGTNGVGKQPASADHHHQQQQHQIAANIPTVSSSASLSSPPSSFAMSAQNSQQQNSTSTNSFPTPASSVSGQFLSAGLEDGDGVARSGVAGFEMLKRKSEGGGPDMMDLDVPTRNDDEGSRHGAMTDKQVKYASAMDVDPKETAFTTDSGLASLQDDVGQAFHVCKTSYTPSGPDPRLDLVSLYGLGPVAASVARTDPVTGEKINRLRKSYEGKIKLLGLSGRNKPVKSEPNAAGGLRELIMWPEEEWYNQKVYGKEIKVAEPDSSLYKMHMRAMRFEPGSIPNNDYWEDILGYEKPAKSFSGESGRKPAPYSPSYASMYTSGQANGTPKATTPRPTASRPQRAGKKRSYTDDSFVGYAEAFAGDDDDDLDGGLYSGGDTGSSKKKRKKDHVSGVPSSVHGGPYGVGMYVNR